MIVCVAVVGHQVRTLTAPTRPSRPIVQIWPDAISSWALLKSSTKNFAFAFLSVLQNNPLYLQSFTEADDALKLHHIVHCSLDVIDERGS